MNEKIEKQLLKIQHRLFVNGKELPSNYWFETYNKGNQIYVQTRWGWGGGRNRGSKHLGRLDLTIPVLLRVYDLLCEEAKDSLSYLVKLHKPQYLPRLNQIIEKVNHPPKINPETRAKYIASLNGGRLIQPFQWGSDNQIIF